MVQPSNRWTWEAEGNNLGGRAIQLVVTETLSVDGAISADGAGGSSASGGSVFIVTKQLTGSGRIRAVGGRTTAISSETARV